MERVTVATREVLIRGLISNALAEVERKYGTGKGDGENPRRYHNRIHSEEVLRTARIIAQLSSEAGKINPFDVSLVEIAASFHDIEQDFGGVQNEIKSAESAEQAMKKAGVFSEEDVDKVKRMILATTVYFENEIMKQSATDDYLTQIIADADLSSLGQSPHIYWGKAKRLLKEITKTDTPSKDEEITFTKKQLTLLKNHQFYTEEARKLFYHCQKNIVFTQQHLESLITN